MNTEHDNPHQKALADASQAREKIDKAIHAFRSEAEDEFRDKMNDDIRAKWGESRKAAQDAERAARESYTQWYEQQAAKVGMVITESWTGKVQRNIPVGTRCFEWCISNKYGAPKGLLKTGRVGVVEVITAASEHPANLKYSKAHRGDIVLRLLKKDGKPGRYLTGWDKNNFWPEGVDPNKEGSK